ncbi:MAG: HPF/RaiA family ribosome-associated protein [Elainellaceae cyanobacterium]
MQVPLELSYRDVERSEAIDALIQEKVEKLEEACDHISHCSIVVERAHVRPDSGSPFRVRIDLTVPPGHEIVAEKSPDQGVQYMPLDAVIREAFDAARRQLVELNERQTGQVKTHPQQVVAGIVTTLFPEENYGFIKTPVEADIYFNRNSVLNDDFDRVELGTGVQFFRVEAEDGPRASSVKIVDTSGIRTPEEKDDDVVAPPMGWEQQDNLNG